MIINGYEIRLYCKEAMEVYDVFKDGRHLGTLRLRHSQFTATYFFGDQDNIVFKAYFKTAHKNAFTEEERAYYFPIAIYFIDKHWKYEQ